MSPDQNTEINATHAVRLKVQSSYFEGEEASSINLGKILAAHKALTVQSLRQRHFLRESRLSSQRDNF
jgi:hypothetical protein